MIHKYTLNDYRIVMDTNSGAVHLFDEIPYIMLDYLTDSVPETMPQQMHDDLVKTYSEADIQEAYQDLRELYEEEVLFSDDGDYEKLANLLVDAPVKSMCLNVAHDCNLRCEYCFAAKGDFGCGRKLMPFEVAKAAIDFLVEKSKNRHNLEVDFFGGEPLMNFKVVKQTVDYARSLEKEKNKNFRFTLTTNGLLLTDDIIEYLNNEMHNVVLSLDGRKEVNDRLRTRVDGSGCYDTIVPKYQKLVANRGDKDYYVRGTFTTHNLDFAEDALHIADLGFPQLSIEPVVSDPKLPYSLKEDNLPAAFSEYERLANIILERRKAKKGFNFFHFMVDLNQGPCAIKRLRGCGAGNEYIAVTPEGDLYPCHQFVGDEDFKMGNVLDHTLNLEMKEEFAKANVYSKDDCKDCWAKFYCSGGCNANNWQYEHDLRKSHKISCELEKKRLECAIMMEAAMADMQAEME